MLTCPICRSRSIRRSSRRNFMEKLWSLSGRYPYRCHDCQTRFYAMRPPDKDVAKAEDKDSAVHHDEDEDV